jgi:hypothetical protein
MRRRIPAHTIGTARLVGPDSRRSGVALTVTAPVSDGEGLSVRDTQEVLELNMHLRRFQQPSLTLVKPPETATTQTPRAHPCRSGTAMSSIRPFRSARQERGSLGRTTMF